MCQTTTATPTARSRKPVTPRTPARPWEWVIRPEACCGGQCVQGAIQIADGQGREQFYRCTLLEADDMNQLWRLEREGPEGYDREHNVCLPTGGAEGLVSCTCDGWKWRRTCKHTENLPLALEWHENNAAA